jgi:hypothetical protein
VGVDYNNICLALVEGGGKCNDHPIYSDAKFIQIWTGYGEVCALTETKDLECEQVGTQMSHVQYPGPWVDVKIGFGDSCMLHQDQGIYCDRGNDGLVSYFPDAHGTEICYVGHSYYCILQEDGTIACVNFDDPRLNFQFDTPLQTISCSYIWEDDDMRHYTACGLVGDGTARCWNDYRGQWSLP